MPSNPERVCLPRTKVSLDQPVIDKSDVQVSWYTPESLTLLMLFILIKDPEFLLGNVALGILFTFNKLPANKIIILHFLSS